MTYSKEEVEEMIQKGIRDALEKHFEKNGKLCVHLRNFEFMRFHSADLDFVLFSYASERDNQNLNI